MPGKKGVPRGDCMTTMVEEAVLIVLDGVGLGEETYRNCHVNTLEDMLMERLAADNCGVLDGSEIEPAGTTIFLYGADGERMFASIEPVLKSYALCRNGKVMIRRGGPGSQQREIRLPEKGV
jgi:hypothetical protein